MSKIKTSEQEPGAKRRGSPKGFHFINLYQCCPRKFYITYIKGYRNKFMAQPLVLGSAFHEGKASWYLGKSEKACIKTALEVVQSYRADLETKEIYEEILFRVENLLHVWIQSFGISDRQQFKVLEVEHELDVKLGDTEFSMTMRPDAILQDKSCDLIYIMETKTSGFSHRITAEAVYYGDQATAYLWGVSKKRKFKPYAVLPDIAYWNKTTRDVRNIQCIRSDLVMRSEYQIEMFENGMKQLFLEATQKALAVKDGYDPDVLFPRNTYYCLSYSHPCEFAHICHQDVKNMKRIPQGFKKDIGNKGLGRPTRDIISIQG